MVSSLDELLKKIKDELGSERIDESHLNGLFEELRSQTESIILDSNLREEEKAKKLNDISMLLREYEKEALKQKELIQGALKKLTKGRRSMKEYRENT
ncbi:MAG: hypothetical protein ACQEVQ_05710 [Pseudomonadota bacterium]